MTFPYLARLLRFPSENGFRRVMEVEKVDGKASDSLDV